MTSARVLGLGQPVAGDDGAALVVLERLREALPPTAVAVELVAVADPTRLVELVRHPGPVWIVDAVIDAGAPGQLLELELAAFEARSSCSVSSHGVDVAQALQLAAVLYPGELSPRLRLLALTIERPFGYRAGLSDAVAQAADRCVQRLLTALAAG